MKGITTSILLLTIRLVLGQEIQFTAEASSNILRQGQSLTVEYSTNANNFEAFSPPDFSPFRIIGGPAKSSRTSIINGSVSHSSSIRYELLAEKPGTYKILPASATIQGKHYSSNAIKIKVTKADQPPPTQNSPAPQEDIFIQVEIAHDTAYVGQQISVDFVLYNNVRTRGVDIVAEPELKDFFVQYPNTYDRSTHKTTIGDQLYEYRTIRRYALFPQFPGTLLIDKMIAKVGVILEGTPSRSFFFLPPTKTITVVSKPKDIQILSPPAHQRPNSFFGAVGNYRFDVKANRTNAKINQAIQMVYQIEGDGDIKKISPPTLTFPAGIEAYEARLIKDESIEKNGKIIGKKSYEYILVPKEAGMLTLEPKGSYFDPATGKYIEQNIKPLQIVISEGALRDNNDDAILYHQSDDQNHEKLAKHWKAWAVPAAGLFSLFLLTLLYYKKRPEKTPTKQNTIDWDEKAKSYLQEAQSALQQGNHKTFYEAIRASIYGYVAHKTGIPLSALTKKTALKALRKAKVAEQLIKQTEDIILQSEVAVFARTSHQTTKSDYQKAASLLAALEKHFALDNSK